VKSAITVITTIVGVYSRSGLADDASFLSDFIEIDLSIQKRGRELEMLLFSQSRRWSTGGMTYLATCRVLDAGDQEGELLIRVRSRHCDGC
jgi:hypothetical protein